MKDLAPILVRSRRRGRERIRGENPDHRIVDLTSRGEPPWHRFSPFFPHGGIPVPHWPGRTAESVEGIWQGLKRFQNEDRIDPARFENRSMRGIKRTSRARGRGGEPRGRVLGHQRGADETTLLDYVSARREIYLPTYRWVLENRLQEEVEELGCLAREAPLVLLDYTTNGCVEDTRTPLSHAALVRAHLTGSWPERVL